MPLKTTEEKKDAIKWIVGLLKTYGVALVAAGASVWGIAEVYLEDYVKETVQKVLDERDGTQSFREILGEEMGVPTDMVPYHIVDRFDQLDSLSMEITKFENKYVPHLDFGLRVAPMYRYVDEDGMEYWMGPDRRGHGILHDNGQAWCVYSGRKVVVGNSY